MDPKVAIAHVVDSRSDFLDLRRSLVAEEISSLDWLRQAVSCQESELLDANGRSADFARSAQVFGAQSLIIHLPIWADPIFTLRLVSLLPLPVLLLGNARPETSSLVGMLGAGGSLDQIGRAHVRVFDHHTPEGRRKVGAFVKAASALSRLRGQTCGLFGGRSLGIFTASADPAQWQKLFGVDMQYVDQLEIPALAEQLPCAEVEPHLHWLVSRVGSVRYGENFSPEKLEKQVRSYLATRKLVEQHGFDFIGVKCQPEMSDGYVTQCVAHMLVNGIEDAGGPKPAMVHACESDADGALTMQILHLLSGGQPVALMDVRWYDAGQGVWTLANCGAVPAALCACAADPSGLSQIHAQPHAFGRGGGGAFPGTVTPGPVTLARLCRKDGQYWMSIAPAEVVKADPQLAERTTPAFPKAFVRFAAGQEFLAEYGSNHIHLVTGDLTEELIALCGMAGIPWKLWT